MKKQIGDLTLRELMSFATKSSCKVCPLTVVCDSWEDCIKTWPEIFHIDLAQEIEIPED